MVGPVENAVQGLCAADVDIPEVMAKIAAT